MQKKLWIGLEGMEFFAFHGVYEEEKLKGGKYVVDVLVYTDAMEAELHDTLSGTINYEKIYAAVELKMKEPAKLIEHLARNIINELRAFISKDDKIKVRIRKIAPPIKGTVANALVEVED